MALSNGTSNFPWGTGTCNNRITSSFFHREEKFTLTFVDNLALQALCSEKIRDGFMKRELDGKIASKLVEIRKGQRKNTFALQLALVVARYRYNIQTRTYGH